MFRALVFCAFLCASTAVFAHDGVDHSPHPDDPVKRAEHMAAINLVDPDACVHVHGAASEYSFAPDIDLYVPAGHEFVIDKSIDVRRILFDGTLRIGTGAMTIRFETIVGNTTGHLSIPPSNNTRILLVRPRGPRDRIGDPTDVTGGIILHSKDNVMCGGPKTPWGRPTSIDPAADTITFGRPMENWRVGDVISIPRVRLEHADEVVTVTAISPDRRVYKTTDILANHLRPDGLHTEACNETRSLIIRSESTELSQRAHFMIMHEHTGTNMEYMSFDGMGRTTVELRPSKIVLGPDGEFISGDSNTIGRYAFHVHGRTGANRNIPPHRLHGCVVTNTPSHGVVNHGGNLSAQYNIVRNCAGSNLFSENGLELGDFSFNVAMGSTGRVSPVDAGAEFAANNFGWQGTTMWLQGPGMDIIGNRLYGAKLALLQFDMFMLPEGGSQHDYPVDYMRDGPHKTAVMNGQFGHSRTKIGIFQVPFYMDGNEGAGAPTGIWMAHSLYDTKSPGDGWIYTKIYAERSKMFNTKIFNVDQGMTGTYIGHIDFVNCRVEGNLKITNYWRPYNGTPDGTKVHDVTYENCEFRNFQVAILDRGWSDLDIKNCVFENNLIDIQIMGKSMNLTDHLVTVSSCRHLGRPAMASLYATKNPATVWGKPKNFWFIDFNAASSKTYSAEVLRPSPHRVNGKLLYYPDNLDTFVPFAGLPSTSPGFKYDKLTNARIWELYGQAVNGRRFSPTDVNMEILAIDSNINIYTPKE